MKKLSLGLLLFNIANVSAMTTEKALKCTLGVFAITGGSAGLYGHMKQKKIADAIGENTANVERNKIYKAGASALGVSALTGLYCFSRTPKGLLLSAKGLLKMTSDMDLLKQLREAPKDAWLDIIDKHYITEQKACVTAFSCISGMYKDHALAKRWIEKAQNINQARFKLCTKEGGCTCDFTRSTFTLLEQAQLKEDLIILEEVLKKLKAKNPKYYYDIEKKE